LLAGVGSAGPDAAVGAGEIGRDDGGRWVRADGTPVPVGRTVEDLVHAACRRGAMPAVRELLTGWQAGAAAGVAAGLVVVDQDGRFHGPDVGGDPLVALRGLAAGLIDGGHAHLWPAPADEAELTALLAGMTGRELDPRDVPAGDRGATNSVRELAIARERLERELAEARAKHEFLERTIANRDAELKRVRRINALLSATAPGKAVVGGLRAVRAVVKRNRR
jgi:hypothetical protein